MENYNSNGKDFYGIERYPNDFMNGLEIDDKIESIPGLMDQMLEGFDKSEKPVKNVEVRQDGLSKFFTYIKNGKVTLNKKAVAVVIAALVTASSIAGAAIGSITSRDSKQSNTSSIVQLLGELGNSDDNQIVKEYLERMDELDSIVENYKNDESLDNRISAVKAVREYKTVALSFFGKEYGYERLSYKDNDGGLLVVGVDKNGELFEFDGPLYVRRAVGNANSIDLYDGDGSSEKWDAQIDSFIGDYKAISNAVNKMCDEKLSESNSLNHQSK